VARLTDNPGASEAYYHYLHPSFGPKGRPRPGVGGPAEGPGRGVPLFPPDQVQLLTEDGVLRVVTSLGDGPAQITDGYGGWEAQDLPGRRARAVWQGVGVPTMALPLLLDGYSTNTSVEPDCEILEAMAGLEVPSGDNGLRYSPAPPGTPRPPQLIVYGPAVPHSTLVAPTARWVVSGLEWTDPVIRTRPNAQRVRQGVNLTLMLAEEDEALSRIRKSKPKPHRQKVRSTSRLNTYEKLAAHYLKNKRYGRKLAHLNGARDPSKHLKDHTLVKLPSEAELAKWKRELKL
jgi:hypothetical protein